MSTDNFLMQGDAMINIFTSICSKVLAAVALFALLISVPDAGVAASFPCKKAATPIEKKICADPELSKLDEELMAAYQRALNVATDKNSVQHRQREWLTAVRDSCRNEKCIQTAYTVRLKELSAFVFTKKGMGLYRCTFGRKLTDNSDMGVNFEIRDGVITNFYSTMAVSSPDLALGYANTCIQHIGKFRQIAGGRERSYVLQLDSPNDQYGESLNCQVHIEDLDSKFHARSLNCLSECMKFDFEVDKNGKACYHEP